MTGKQLAKKKVPKTQDLSETKKKEIQATEQAITVPLNAEERETLDRWKKGEEEAQAPFKFEAEITPQITKLSLKPLTKRGTPNEQNCLMNAAICETVGVKNYSFASRLFLYGAAATGLLQGSDPKDNADIHNLVADALHSMKPLDAFEGMLLSQIIALHFQSMSYLASSSSKDLPTQVKDTHLNRATKLGRLFNEKLDALMRYRRKEQKITVQHQHVNVENGGQAIVGNVHNGSGVQR